jgi:hypothetical protein
LDDEPSYALSFLEGNWLMQASITAAAEFGELVLRSLLLRMPDCRGDLAAGKAKVPEHPVIELHELLFGPTIRPLKEVLGQHLSRTRYDVSHNTSACSVRINETSAYTALQLGFGACGHL